MSSGCTGASGSQTRCWETRAPRLLASDGISQMDKLSLFFLPSLDFSMNTSRSGGAEGSPASDSRALGLLEAVWLHLSTLLFSVHLQLGPPDLLVSPCSPSLLISSPSVFTATAVANTSLPALSSFPSLPSATNTLVYTILSLLRNFPSHF